MRFGWIERGDVFFFLFFFIDGRAMDFSWCLGRSVFS